MARSPARSARNSPNSATTVFPVPVGAATSTDRPRSSARIASSWNGSSAYGSPAQNSATSSELRAPSSEGFAPARAPPRTSAPRSPAPTSRAERPALTPRLPSPTPAPRTPPPTPHPPSPARAPTGLIPSPAPRGPQNPSVHRGTRNPELGPRN